MSWNVTVTDINPNTEIVEQAAKQAYAKFKATYSATADEREAMDEQFEAALFSVRALLGGAVGADDVNVTLAGHANPGHKPRQGWANDYVSVHVSSVVRAEVPAASTE